MANLTEAAKRQKEAKQVPLPIFDADVAVDGSIVTLKIDVDKLAQIAVEREGERDERGTKVKYTKNPAVMLRAKMTERVQVIQGDQLFEIDFQLGQGGNGVYCNIARPTLLGDMKPEVA